ncbi:MAG: hypothetical protein AB7G48_08565 [Nitrospiraceae bacterium]
MTHRTDLSALHLLRQLGIGRYETAWVMLQKLGQAMVWLHRERFDKAFVVGAVDVHGLASGWVRLQVIPDALAPSLTGFVTRDMEPGIIVVTDG